MFPKPFAHEKLSPVLALYKAKDFEDALCKAETLVADGGYGHTSSRYIHPLSNREDGSACRPNENLRILVNTPSSQGGIGDLYNFKLAPSLTLGCGSYGGNSCFRKRRRKTSDQYQDCCREERKYALVPHPAESVFQKRLSAGSLK